MIHPAEVELTKDLEHLIFSAKDNPDCKRLWSQLAGQLLNPAEEGQKIYYNMPEDFPEGTTLEIEGDTDQLLLLLEFLEKQKEGKFLSSGTTEKIRNQLKANEEIPATHDAGESHQEPVDTERKYSPK